MRNVISVSKNNFIFYLVINLRTKKHYGLDKLGGWMVSVFLSICSVAISTGHVLRSLLTSSLHQKKKKIKILLPTPNWGMNPKAFANKVREVLWLLL